MPSKPGHPISSSSRPCPESAAGTLLAESLSFSESIPFPTGSITLSQRPPSCLQEGQLAHGTAGHPHPLLLLGIAVQSPASRFHSEE